MSAFFYPSGGVEEGDSHLAWSFSSPVTASAPVTVPAPAPAPTNGEDDDENDNEYDNEYDDYNYDEDDQLLPMGYLISHDDSDDQACPADPAPTRPSFLHNILNPVEHNTNTHDMSPARPPNGYVDLTHESSELSARKPRRASPTPGPSTKRLRRNDGTAAPAQADDAAIDAIDLSGDKTKSQNAPQKQKEQQAQPNDEEKPTTFNTFNCVICMDTPTDLTATACGHLFCHTCLMEALIAGENRGGPGEPRRSQCPVCRKNISRTKPTDVIPLLLMKGLRSQPRKTRPVMATTSPAATGSKKLANLPPRPARRLAPQPLPLRPVTRAPAPRMRPRNAGPPRRIASRRPSAGRANARIQGSALNTDHVDEL